VSGQGRNNRNLVNISRALNLCHFSKGRHHSGEIAKSSLTVPGFTSPGYKNDAAKADAPAVFGICLCFMLTAYI
jgi:hypothetical protein